MKKRNFASLLMVPMVGALCWSASGAQAEEAVAEKAVAEEAVAEKAAAPAQSAPPVVLAAEKATTDSGAQATQEVEAKAVTDSGAALGKAVDELAKPRVLLAQTDAAPPAVGGRVGAPPAGAPAGAPGAPPPGMPPLSVILGYADFMLAIDRPYEAEKIYKRIQANMPKLDPNDPKVIEMMKNMPKEQLEGMKQAMAAVQKGLADVEYAKRPTVTLLAHDYRDDRDVQLYAYGGGPTFRAPWGRWTLTAGTGHYRNNNDPNNANNPLSLSPDIPSAEDNDTVRKSTLNLLLEPYFKKWEGNFFFSKVTYDNAPDRFLYDLKVSYVQDPARERYYVSHGRHDSYFQNVNNQFYAPETYFQLKKKIVYDDYAVGAEFPVDKRWDGTFSYRYFEYTDGNRRSNFRTQLMYRLKPTKGKMMPVWRVGADLIFDDSKFFTLDYTASENFNAYSLATDYMWISRKVKYGLYASYPIADQNFNAPYGVFGFASYQVNKSTEVYAKLARLSGEGNSLTFLDTVVGVNVRF